MQYDINISLCSDVRNYKECSKANNATINDYATFSYYIDGF